MAEQLAVLLTSVGRRCELVGLFSDAIRSTGFEPLIVGVDTSVLAPALSFCDATYKVPSVGHVDYVDSLLQAVRETGARLVVPLIDPDLPVIAAHSELFLGEGATPLVPPLEAVAVCEDKYETWKMFERAGVPAPLAALPPDGLPDDRFPVVVKPRRGSASEGVCICHGQTDLDRATTALREPMVQMLAPGVELTIDVLTDLEGRLVQAVARERIRTRGGESSIGVTVGLGDAEEHIEHIVAELKPRGPITVQCFRDEHEGVLFTEVNPRFGGGYPLADAAGAAYPRDVVRMCLGLPVSQTLGDYRVGLAMSRYDRSIFFEMDRGAMSADAWSSEDTSKR